MIQWAETQILNCNKRIADTRKQNLILNKKKMTMNVEYGYNASISRATISSVSYII